MEPQEGKIYSMLTQQIRRKFLYYFREHGHTIVPSSSVAAHGDPTLLFTNAGMNQFKDVFLGNSFRHYTKAASSQKCIRVGGKHNDLENVGHTGRHLTFFEMLGNFSFGDYFKKEAIQFAWDVSINVFGFEKDRIWATIYQNDEETFEYWRAHIPQERICRFGVKQNFWAMGDTGPCGPCSELLYDRGPSYGKAASPLEDVDETRYLEFWNLVFMQSNRDEKGILSALPMPSIDTGAGLERIVNLKMGVDSVYDTDILRELITSIEHLSQVSYSCDNEEKAAPFRVIADHLRCLAFAIADGIQPSNVDRGYVLRKVLRRAVRYGRTLGLVNPFLAQLFPTLIALMGEDYPELITSKERIEELLITEEEAYLRTLRRGGNLLSQVIDQAKTEKRKITGDEAFRLKDTYGFPLEEILLLARDAGLAVDTKRYTALEEEARERSRGARQTTTQIAADHFFSNHVREHGSAEFLGYGQLTAEAKVTGIVVNDQFVSTLSPGKEGILLLNRTPFYAESGGQVGDTGTLRAAETIIEVTDCQTPFKGVIAHVCKAIKGGIKVGDYLKAEVDSNRRQKIANNHTATHLLHWALCHVLGDHVKQAGSVVNENRLRFDFNHHKALTQIEIRKIEDLVNQKVRENRQVFAYDVPLEDVQKNNKIKQFFGEKYEQIVRVIDIDDSKELCGGTHTRATGNIGYFRIAKEGSIAAGLRRIEAVTGSEAETLSRQDQNLIEKISEKLKCTPSKAALRLEKLIEENKALIQDLQTVKSMQLKETVKSLLTKVETIEGISLIAQIIPLAPIELKDCAEEAINQLSPCIVILGTISGSKCQVLARVSQTLVDQGMSAKALIATLAPIIGGKGGGKAHFAQAGGALPEKLEEAFSFIREWVKNFQKSN